MHESFDIRAVIRMSKDSCIIVIRPLSFTIELDARIIDAQILQQWCTNPSTSELSFECHSTFELSKTDFDYRFSVLILFVGPGIRRWIFKIREQFWYKLLSYLFKWLPYLLVNPTDKISLFECHSTLDVHYHVRLFSYDCAAEIHPNKIKLLRQNAGP